VHSLPLVLCVTYQGSFPLAVHRLQYQRDFMYCFVRQLRFSGNIEKPGLYATAAFLFALEDYAELEFDALGNKAEALV